MRYKPQYLLPYVVFSERADHLIPFPDSSSNAVYSKNTHEIVNSSSLALYSACVKIQDTILLDISLEPLSLVTVEKKLDLSLLFYLTGNTKKYKTH